MSQNLTVHTNTWSAVRIALIAGAIAGPLYVGVGTLEAVLRSGFDIRIHSLSLLANGSWGRGAFRDDGCERPAHRHWRPRRQ